jgi:hypothetical protein
MFDPAVIGTTNIGMRGVGTGHPGAPNHRPGWRRSLRRTFARRIAGGMRAVADWMDPILPSRASDGPQGDPPVAPPRAAVSSRT